LEQFSSDKNKIYQKHIKKNFSLLKIYPISHFCKEIGSLFALLFSIFSSKWLFVTSKWQKVVFLFCSYYFHFQNPRYYSVALTLIHQALVDLNWSISIPSCEGNHVSTHNFISLCTTLKAKFQEWCGEYF